MNRIHKTKVPLPSGENQFDYTAFIIQLEKHQQCTEGTNNTFSVLFYALMMCVLRRCIC